MFYIPRETNIIQTILQENYADFEKIYDEVYAKDYGIFRLERISESVLKFTDCGDWLQGIARIKCTNADCKHEYLHPHANNGIFVLHAIKKDCYCSNS